MTMREKLIELLEEAEGLVNNDEPSLEQIADHLIAHGVTIATDNNVGSKNRCDYCQEDADGYFRMFGAFAITNPFHGKEWFLETAHCKPRNIFFCPKCGRKLAEPPKED